MFSSFNGFAKDIEYVLLFIVNPLDGAEVIVSFVGILLFVYSLSDIVDMCIFKKNINVIKKNIKDGLKIIDVKE